MVREKGLYHIDDMMKGEAEGDVEDLVKAWSRTNGGVVVGHQELEKSNFLFITQASPDTCQVSI
jgi:hypothetical protein